jgi:hypothetical protein
MKLKKTDRRYKMKLYDFDYFVEFDLLSAKQYNLCVNQCRALFGNEFWFHRDHIYHRNGQWRSEISQKPETWGRIYLKNQKQYTLLSLAV